MQRLPAIFSRKSFYIPRVSNNIGTLFVKLVYVLMYNAKEIIIYK